MSHEVQDALGAGRVEELAACERAVEGRAGLERPDRPPERAPAARVRLPLEHGLGVPGAAQHRLDLRGAVVERPPQPQRGVVVRTRDGELDVVPIRLPGRNAGNDDRHLHGRPRPRGPDLAEALDRAARQRARCPSDRHGSLSYGQAMLRARVAVGLCAAAALAATVLLLGHRQRPGSRWGGVLLGRGRGVHDRLAARHPLLRRRAGNRARCQADHSAYAGGPGGLGRADRAECRYACRARAVAAPARARAASPVPLRRLRVDRDAAAPQALARLQSHSHRARPPVPGPDRPRSRRVVPVPGHPASGCAVSSSWVAWTSASRSTRIASWPAALCAMPSAPWRETLPYRTTVLHPGGGPRRRWERASNDDYRLWGDPKGVPVVVDTGVTRRARWTLYLRLPARGGMCVGMSVRRLWRGAHGPSGEGCGARRLPPLENRIALFGAGKLGDFAYGHTGAKVYSVRVQFEGEEEKEVQTTFTPIPPGGRGRFWVVPAEGDCRTSRSRRSVPTATSSTSSGSTVRQPARAADAAARGSRTPSSRPRGRASGAARRGTSSGGGATVSWGPASAAFRPPAARSRR